LQENKKGYKSKEILTIYENMLLSAWLLFFFKLFLSPQVGLLADETDLLSLKRKPLQLFWVNEEIETLRAKVKIGILKD